MMDGSKRLFEIKMAMDALPEIIEEYNKTLTKGREPIEDYEFNDNKILIFFKTYAYYVFIYKNAFVLSWLRKDDKKNRWINDGNEVITNISSLIRSINDRIFSGFSPRRGYSWYHFGLPKNRERQFHSFKRNDDPA